MRKKAIIISLKGYKLSKKEKLLISKEKPWGLILFKRNIKSLSQIKKLVFDIKKLSFSVTACPNGDRLVDILSYGTIDFDNMGGDTTGKGSDFQIFEW